MSGLVKPKSYDWTDSNMALFGSDTDKQVKKESAETEPAWKGSGQSPGIEIWRIEKFTVKHWPKEEYGKFYSGDSYIILNTYKEADSKELKYDLHFWIGKESTQDEYGTAAYKTVELDTFHNDAPVQHREVEGHECALFKSYFKQLTYLKGGMASGFRHVKTEEYSPRLFFVSGTRKNVTVKEVGFSKSKLNSNDVFIIDSGSKLIQWRGKDCNKDESLKGVQYMSELASSRHGKAKCETVDEGDEDESFWGSFPENDAVDDDDDDEDDEEPTNKLIRISDESGNLKMTVEAEGNSIKRDLLKSKDVFILDTGKSCFVWIGRGASKNEKRNAMGYAHKHLQSTNHKLVPVTVLKEPTSDHNFNAIFSS